MKSLFDMANDYERWAALNETHAAAILAYLPRYNPDIREKEAHRASVLLYEAQCYRENAIRFRTRSEREGLRDKAVPSQVPGEAGA